MTTLFQPHKHNAIRVASVKILDKLIEMLMPRPCMMVSTGLILAGSSIPMLIAMQLLTCTVLVGFAGFALVAVGGVMALIFCGEI